MELPPISDGFRLIVWVIVGASTAVSVFLGNAFEDNINFFFRKIANKHLKEQAPAPIPIFVKLISVVLFLVVIVGTGFASAAPDDNLESFIAQSLSSAGAAGNSGNAQSTTPTSELADTLSQETAEPSADTTIEAGAGSVSFLAVVSEWSWRENTEASVAAGASQYTTAVAASSESQLLVAAGFPDGTLGLFELADGQLSPVGELHRSDFFNRLNDLEFIPGQQAIVTGSIAGDLSTWNYSTDGISATPAAKRRLNAGINALSLSPDGQIVAAGQAHATSGADADDSSISFNLPLTSDMRQTYAVLNTNQKDILDLVFTINGELFVVGKAPTLVRFGPNATAPRLDYLNATSLGTTSVEALLASPTDGTLAYVSLADETLALFSAPTEQKLQTSGLLGGVVTAMAFHPDQTVIAAGTSGCTVKLLDAGTLEILETSADLCTEFEQGWSKEIGSLAFSPDGSYLIAGTSAGFFVLNTQD
jgi:WD40 repeat protein